MDRLDTIREGLISLFDEMLTHGKEFKRSLYAGAFETGRKEHEEIVNAITECCKEASKEEKEAVIEKIAGIIPEYASEKMQDIKKSKREKYSIDFNMNMAVYVVPILNFNRDEDCIAITKRMVEIWNEKKVTSMQLTHSTYEDVAAGFERRFCYITTAVCDSQGKPDNCYELTAFRNFRDSYLLRSEEGQKLVEEYYEIAPGIVMLINMQKNSKEIYDSIYEKYLMPCLGFIEDGKEEACQQHYVSMVRELEGKYLYS